jgi:hypothetical protein
MLALVTTPSQADPILFPLSLPKILTDMCLERDIVGVKKDTGEMVLLASEADLDEDLSIPVSTLKRFPHFQIITKRQFQ